MFEKFVPCYISVLTFLKLITVTHLTFHDSSHGFITKNARYFEDEISHFQEEIGSLRYLQKPDSPGGLNVRFEPEFLDFSQRPLGVLHSKTVTLYNTDSNKTIDLTSISGDTVHFHSSFFEDKRIPPNGNTSFKIVYLGRQEGPVESSLFLHTSSGSIKYNVKAFGTFSNYRVRPIVGVKLPVNSTFTPVIYMHNPHSEPIQIVEIYSSGGGFRLELPSGQHEGPHDLWEIYPQETKAIIRVRFEAKIAQNHTAYIRIKLYDPEEILIIPLEVEVTPAQNIFHPQGHVDFGVGGSMDVPKEVNLCLFNPLKRAIRVHSVSTLSKSIKTHYYNVRINPGNEEENTCVSVGTLTVDWKNAFKDKDYYGKIIVKYRNGKNRTEIPYYITVIKGGLSYDKTITTYFLNDKEMDTTERKFEVLNEFLHPIKILDVKFPFDVDSTFKIETLTPRIIKPLHKQNIFNIKLKNGVKSTNMQLTSYIKLITNITEVQVPLLSYNGKVQIHLPFTSNDFSFNVGLIGYLTTKEIYFTLTNPNPVDLPLLSVRNTMPMVELLIQGCGTGDHKTVLLLNLFSNLTKCDKISSYGFAIIKVTITSKSAVGQLWEKIEIQTPFENLSLPVQFKISPGNFSIAPEELVFSNCFPTKTCTHSLRVHSTFSEKMVVDKILALPLNKKISASITDIIMPNANQVIGKMFFNPDLDCAPECYVGFLNEGSALWLKSMTITKQVLEYDLQLLKIFYNRFLNFTSRGSRSTANISLRLDTSEIKGHFFQSRVKYIWPSLIPENSIVANSTLEFPLTQVGNSSNQYLVIRNPSSHNVVVQLLFDWDYPHVEMLCDGLPTAFLPITDFKFSNKGFFFDKKLQESQRADFWNNMRINAYKHSLPFLLTPGESKKIFVGFVADEARTYSNLLLLRNNLTILEIIRLEGKGSVPIFKFGNRKPGAVQPLTFEINEKNLKDCVREDEEKFFMFLPNLTVKRSFTAKNLGEIPVHVFNFHINGYECEGFGFKVLNCEPFLLPPNASKRVDIAFTTDLTLSKVSRTLVLSTSLNAFVNYSLYATIPYAYCTACDKQIERPPWETYMSYITIVFMKVMFFLIMFIAVLDAEAIKRQAWDLFISSNTPPILPVLDLRKIGKQVKEEMQFKENNKPEPDIVDEISEIEQEVTRNEPAIVPTTGKRKLAQRNSFNDEEANIDDEHNFEVSDKERNRKRQTKKHILFERHRLKSKERKTERELKLLEEKERKEKHAQHKEAELKRIRTILNKKTPKTNQEEEASSTTTEGSNSSTEMDKENQESKNWLKKKTEHVPEKSHKAKDSIINLTEYKSKHVSFVNSKLKGKPKKPDKLHEHESVKDKVYSHNRDPKRRNEKVKDRKDKLIYRNKNLGERRSKTSESDSTSEKESSKSPITFFIPFPTPTTTSSAWCESRAKFSDVVARNEVPPDSQAVSDHPTNETNARRQNLSSRSNIETALRQPSKPMTVKPTLYVEPYKLIDLGPIGSKRLGVQGGESPDLFLKEQHSLLKEEYLPTGHYQNALNNQYVEFSPINDKSVIAAISNNTLLANDSSFFSKPQGMRLKGNDGSNVFKNVSSMGLWNQQQQQQHIFGNVQEQEQRAMKPNKAVLNEPADLPGLWNQQQQQQQHIFGSVQEQEQRVMEPNKAVLNEPVDLPGLWNQQQQQQHIFGNVQEQEQRVMEPNKAVLNEPVDDSWNRVTNNYWSNTFSNVLDSTSKLTSNASYLWGSNPIWKPWSPAEVSSTPRRTPPGFDEQIQKKKRSEEELKRLQQRESYSPFGSGSSWAEQKEP